MKNSTLAPILLLTVLCQATFGQSSVVFQHPKDQIAMQLGAIQMGYAVQFALVSKNATNAQQAANALAMGRYALDVTISKPTPKVQGAVNSPGVNTVEFRDQLYQAVEAVLTSPVVGSIRGSVTLVGGKKQTISATLTLPPNSHTISVPFALEAATSVDAQILTPKVRNLTTELESIRARNLSLTANITAFQSQSAAFSSNISATQNQTSNINSYLIALNQKLIDSGILTGYVSSFVGGVTGFADGQGTAAGFEGPLGAAVDGNGNIYVADTNSNRIRKITPSGNVSTLAVSGESAYTDGVGTAASFAAPQGVALDATGNVYVAGTMNNRFIRKSCV